MKNTIHSRLKTLTENNTLDDQEMIRSIKGILYEYGAAGYSVAEPKQIAELVDDSMTVLQQSSSVNTLIPSGFSNLDKVIGGFMPGEFIVVGGRPGMGKTQLLVNLALNISRQQPVLYFTFDISDVILTYRLLSTLSGIPIDKILQRKLNEQEVKKLSECALILKEHKLYVNDSCHNSVTLLAQQCEKMIKENGVKVIILDYIQMMGSGNYRYNREQELSTICHELKNIARANDVCVIVSSQLNRSVEMRGGDKKPQLSDLRDTGTIEQDADKVFFLWRPEYYKLEMDADGTSLVGMAELIIAKNRNGKFGSVLLRRDESFTTYYDYEEQSFEFTISAIHLSELDK